MTLFCTKNVDKADGFEIANTMYCCIKYPCIAEECNIAVY
jgi:hypothetical protein